MFLLHVMPYIWWEEGIPSFAFWQEKLLQFKKWCYLLMTKSLEKKIKLKEQTNKPASSVSKSRRPGLLQKKKVFILTVTTKSFVVCFYQQLTSVQNCPVWHWCSTSHIQAAFNQGWNGIWFRNPLRIIYRKKNLCSQISKSLL